MQLLPGINSLALQNFSFDSSVVTIGNFDGVHLGHQRIIELVREQSRSWGIPSVVFTFRPHPQEVLRSNFKVSLLSTYEEKADLIQAMGIDVLVEEPSVPEFFQLSPEVFFDKILVQLFKARSVVVGHDFAFGKGRSGNIELLTHFCRKQGILLTVVPPASVEGEVVSSSVIRRHLLDGEVQVAYKLLGRPFCYHGHVTRGDARGRLLGFPTANFLIDTKKVGLPYGVYATRCVFREGADKPLVTRSSVTNIGVRPTFASEQPLVETHILDQPWVDLYGQVLEIQMLKKIREEIRFKSLDDLKAQIERDIIVARSVNF